MIEREPPVLMPTLNPKKRTVQRELLDDGEPGQAIASVRDIARINRYFGGHAVLRRLVGRVVDRHTRFDLLDVGSASGDSVSALAQDFPLGRYTCLDYRMSHLGSGPGRRVVADAFHLPFGPGSFDIVTANLFLHHFEDDEVVELLRAFRRVARHAIIVTDLYRHAFAYHLIPATRWVFGWHAITVHDAAASVAAAFRPAELRTLAKEAGLAKAVIRSHWPWFRTSLSATFTLR